MKFSFNFSSKAQITFIPWPLLPVLSSSSSRLGRALTSSVFLHRKCTRLLSFKSCLSGLLKDKVHIFFLNLFIKPILTELGKCDCTMGKGRPSFFFFFVWTQWQDKGGTAHYKEYTLIKLPSTKYSSSTTLDANVCFLSGRRNRQHFSF